jgi:predicted alpha/beta superfamily hydrolase
MPAPTHRPDLRWPTQGEGRPGTLELIPNVFSPQLRNERDLLVYLPEGHDRGERRYAVIYMHDGQNLFDPATSFAGHWQVPETMAQASIQGFDAIVVGVPNMATERIAEYSPFVDPKLGGGKGERYVEFLVRTVKPLIDRRYHTHTDRRHTGIGGSSMGGLISLHAFFTRPETFGFTAVMSPSLWFADGAIFPVIEGAEHHPGRIHLDIGGLEGERHVANARRLRDLLEAKGYRRDQDLHWVEDELGQHTESAWAWRFREAIAFLLSGQGERRSQPRPGSGRRAADKAT